MSWIVLGGMLLFLLIGVEKVIGIIIFAVRDAVEIEVLEQNKNTEEKGN